MKRLLIISLFVNLALIALVARHKAHQLAAPVREVRGEIQSKQGSYQQRRTQAATQTAVTPWSKIENHDTRQFIANLRAIGCPETTVRDIATLRICRSYRERLLEFETEAQRISDTLTMSDWQKLQEKHQNLRDEMHSELESVLGQDWATLSSALNGFPNSKSDLTKILSEEKRVQLREIDKQFRHEIDELRQKQTLYGLENDEVAAFRTLERQKRDALAAVLSPLELEDYLYRNSPAADYVRRNLPEAKNESEYRMMVKLALEMDLSQTLDSPQRHYGLNGDTDTVKADIESQKKRQDYERRLKEMLGEDRIAEQQAAEKARAEAETQVQEEQNKQRMQQEVVSAAMEVGVNAENANKFFARLNEAEPALKKKFEEMEKSLAGTPQEKQKQMEAAVKAELNNLAIETMGDKGPAVVEKMFKNNK